MFGIRYHNPHIHRWSRKIQIALFYPPYGYSPRIYITVLNAVNACICMRGMLLDDPAIPRISIMTKLLQRQATPSIYQFQSSASGVLELRFPLLDPLGRPLFLGVFADVALDFLFLPRPLVGIVWFSSPTSSGVI